MNQNSTIGRLGEDAAAAWLQRHGHSIVSRNFRTGRVELDIVSTDSMGIHFVEVKSRKAPVTADPVVNVTHSKQQHLIKAAQSFLHKGGFPPLEIFFDIITVVFYNHNTTIHYYPQAFIPIYA